MAKEFLEKILGGHDLSQDEATNVADAIMEGELNPELIAGLLVALRMKGECAAEIAGFVESMRRHSVRLNLNDSKAVDGVGTGGDGSGSFNISTAAGIVAAGAGVTVAKHGNRAVSSKCGSADLLEATGANIDPGPGRAQAGIDKLGFGFMFAPRFHPAMKHAIGPRRALGVRTIFNILGPMTNPAGVTRQLIGVYDKQLMPIMAEVLVLTGSDHVVIVHSHDGLDEISISAPTDVLTLKDGQIAQSVISPDKVGLQVHCAGAVAGGVAAENLQILNDLLAGDKSPYRDVVALNAGVMVMLGGAADNIPDGVSLALDAIDSGRARKLLAAWIEFTRA